MPIEIRQLLPTQITDFVQIAVIWVVIYLVLRVVRGTIAGSILRGAVLVVAFTVVLAAVVLRHFELRVVEQILAAVGNVTVLALLVVFAPELRRGLLSLGEHRFLLRFRPRQAVGCLDDLAEAVTDMSRMKCGALIAIERNNSLHHIAGTGVTLDAEARAELLKTVFWPKSPLHDGGVIIRGDRVLAAACIFPLAERRELASGLGTRHRAGLGLSEESDAIVVIVSEETGRVSIAHQGDLQSVEPASEIAGALAAIIRGNDGGRRRRELATKRAAPGAETTDSDGRGDGRGDGPGPRPPSATPPATAAAAATRTAAS
jgi:diadenylate cyclase